VAGGFVVEEAVVVLDGTVVLGDVGVVELLVLEALVVDEVVSDGLVVVVVVVDELAPGPRFVGSLPLSNTTPLRPVFTLVLPSKPRPDSIHCHS
jgi:hypothetical protein